MTPEQTFLAHLPFIERVAPSFCRRRRLRPEDEEDFISLVKIHLIEDDYRVLREFKNGCTLRTYLTTVIHNFGRDYLDKLWGKWRPSEEAKRLGPVAVRLEQLIVRDGLTFEEACEILRRNEKVQTSVAELEGLATRLPRRTGRRLEGEEQLAIRAAQERTDERVEEAERARRRTEVWEIYQRAFRSLAAEDQLLLRMVADGIPVARIARSLGLRQKRVYPRRDRLFATLRRRMEAEGVRSEDIAEILGAECPPEFLGGPGPEGESGT